MKLNFQFFFVYRNPHPANSLEPTIPIAEHALNYMEFTNSGVFLEINPFDRRMAFWRDFFNLNKFHVKKIAYAIEP